MALRLARYQKQKKIMYVDFADFVKVRKEICLLKFLFPAIILFMFLLSSMLHITFLCRFLQRFGLSKWLPRIWYLFVYALIEGWLVSPALLGDDLLQFLWLDPFLLVLRKSTYRCKDSQSINWFLRLFIVGLVIINALAYVDPKLFHACEQLHRS